MTIIAINLQRFHRQGLYNLNHCEQFILRICDSIQRRTYEHVLAAYKVIFQKLLDPTNVYPPINNIKTMEEV